MTVLWCGGEPECFPNGAIPTSGTAPRSTYSRAGWYQPNGLLCLGAVFPGGGVTELWAMTAAYINTNSGAAYNGVILTLGKSANGTTGNLWAIRRKDNKLDLATRISDSWTVVATDASTILTSGSAAKKFDWNFKLAEAGFCKVYVDGSLIIDYSGDTRITDVDQIDQVGFIGGSNNTHVNLSEFIVSDMDTRLMALKTLAPNAAGDTNSWSGEYTAIDESTASDSDTIFTTEVDKVFQCNLTGMPAGDWVVHAVKMAYRAADGVGGIGIQGGIKTNGELHLGTVNEPGGYWENYEEFYTENPETLNRFSSAEIEALQIAFLTVDTSE